MSKRLSEELKNVVVSDYLSGVTVREIIKKHKTYELYSILKEKGIEYKQNNNLQKEKYKKVIELYNKDEKIEDIVKKTGVKDVYKILKKYKIESKRNPKEYNTNKKDERNKILIDEYFSGNLSVEDLCKKYQMTHTNLYRILKVYALYDKKQKNHHWVIHQKLSKTPNIKCKFYILEDYYGYTKIGITTKNKVNERFKTNKKNIKVFYEIENTLKYCYNLESKLKKLLKIYRPENMNKKIDGWSECFDIVPEKVLDHIIL